MLKSPRKIIFTWIIGCLVIGISISILSEIGASGGEQKFIINFVRTIQIMFIGVAILLLIIPFLFRTWVKRYWLLN